MRCLLALLVVSLTACTSWRNTSVPVTTLAAPRPQGEEKLRLILRDGRSVVVTDPVLRGDSIVATGVAIPVQSIDLIQVRRPDSKKTIKLLGASALGVLTILMAQSIDQIGK